GETDPGETGPGETDPGETGPGETDPGETGPGETGPSGPRRLGHGGIDLSGQPCEPGSDPGCAAIVVRASERVSRGAIGPVLDALQDVHEALSPAAARRNGAFASTVERLARDAFDPDARRGSALVAEVETPADRDGAWADLRHPLVLKRSMARAAAMRDRARDAY
ncbi:MAG: hypothetical protein ACJ768_20625, partial [Gaiellaceae bacterium]